MTHVHISFYSLFQPEGNHVNLFIDTAFMFYLLFNFVLYAILALLA